jgi:hypothetical protein
MSGLCDCGHYEREHERIDLAGWTGSHCTGNTWAYPDDAEGDDRVGAGQVDEVRWRDGREVRCRCQGFDPVEENNQ